MSVKSIFCSIISTYRDFDNSSSLHIGITDSKGTVSFGLMQVNRAKKKICGSGCPTYPKFLSPTINFFLQILKLEENSRTK